SLTGRQPRSSVKSAESSWRCWSTGLADAACAHSEPMTTRTARAAALRTTDPLLAERTVLQPTHRTLTERARGRLLLDGEVALRPVRRRGEPPLAGHERDAVRARPGLRGGAERDRLHAAHADDQAGLLRLVGDRDRVAAGFER